MRYVRYIGLAHQRQITAADWRTVGINADTVVWNAFNGFAVPLEMLTDEQIRKAIEPDQNFVITGEGEDQDDEFKPDLTATHPMTPQQLEANGVDILGADERVQVSTTGSEASTAAPAGTGGTGRGTAGHDEPATTSRSTKK